MTHLDRLFLGTLQENWLSIDRLSAQAWRLRFYALSRSSQPLVLIADAEKVISELVTNYHWKEEVDIEGILKPQTVRSGYDLDWAFVGISTLTWDQVMKCE